MPAADVPQLILGGGVFNNELLLRALYQKLAPEFTLLFPQETAAGDAAISLGQAFYSSLQN